MRKIILAAFPLLCTLASSFVTPINQHQQQHRAFLPSQSPHTAVSPSSLSMAGFGEASSKKTTTKLKPKVQWDRYKKLKSASPVYVAARVANEGEDAGAWSSIGTVKSAGDEYTESAVGLQKGIIAEHAKRLYPLQFLPKGRVQFGYSSSSDSTEYTAIQDKPDTSSGIEKKIGFQGNADPSGYYSKTGSTGYEGNSGKKDRGYGVRGSGTTLA